MGKVKISDKYTYTHITHRLLDDESAPPHASPPAPPQVKKHLRYHQRLLIGQSSMSTPNLIGHDVSRVASDASSVDASAGGIKRKST